MSGSLRFGPPKGGWPNFTQDGNESTLEVPYFARPATESPRLTANQLREEGYLQEVNRNFFHPLGLALVADLDNNLIWVADCRDDPEGVYFGYDILSAEKRNHVKELWHARREARHTALGFVIQPYSKIEIDPDYRGAPWGPDNGN